MLKTLRLPYVVIATCLLLMGFYSAKRLPRILVFSKTGGFHHTSIPAGIAAITKLGQENGFAVDTTTDSLLFTKSNLKKYKAIVFLSTSGNILDTTGKLALLWFIKHGGGYVGIHGASTTVYGWPLYNRLVGATFNKHPEQQYAMLTTTDTGFIATRGVQHAWRWWDEWYNFKDTHWDDVHVLLTVDESTYKGGTLGAYHPISWYHAFEGGRAFYTALGHTDSAFSNPVFLAHVLGGIEYAMGTEK